MTENRPDIVDEIKSGKIQLIVNTPSGKSGKIDDSYIRKSAIKYKIPYITTLSAASAAAKGIEDYLKKQGKIKSLQEYHKSIGDSE
jgi:carbamoyl-phosphate synthase large subunit